MGVVDEGHQLPGLEATGHVLALAEHGAVHRVYVEPVETQPRPSGGTRRYAQLGGAPGSRFGRQQGHPQARVVALHGRRQGAGGQRLATARRLVEGRVEPGVDLVGEGDEAAGQAGEGQEQRHRQPDVAVPEHGPVAGAAHQL
ncbi:hypothetical protein FQZ97_1060660 [compost metagenome]